MARYLIREAHGGETRTIRDGALPYFPGWVIIDTLDDDSDTPPLYLSKAEGDLRWAKIADLGDPESAEVAVISEAVAPLVADSEELRAASVAAAAAAIGNPGTDLGAAAAAALGTVAPMAIPSTPIARDADSTYTANQLVLVPASVAKRRRVRRARLRVATAGGDISVGAVDVAMNRLVTSGAVGNGPGGFPIEVALPPTVIPAGPVNVAFSTSNATAAFASATLAGDILGAQTKATSGHPIPAAVTALAPSAKVPCVTLLGDDPTPLAGTAYARTDMGVYVVGQNPVSGKLVGYRVDNGNWSESTDNGVTWSDTGHNPATDFGAGVRVAGLIFNPAGTVQYAITENGKLWSSSADFYVTWADRTPPGMPANTTGRYANAAHNGTVLFFSNYGLAGAYSTPGSPPGAHVYKSTDGGATWTTALSVATARHVHAVRVDPTDANKIHVNIGDQGWTGYGYYYSPDAGVTWYQGASGNATPGAASSNRYGIDLCFPAGVGGTPGRIFMEGDGTAQPHVFQYYRANFGAGMQNAKIDPTVWFDAAPEDGNASWAGSTRGLYATSEGNLFFITTGEGGAIGTRYGIWLAKGPWFTSPVLLEELTAPWDYPVYNFGRTFEAGPYLLNTRYRITRPKFAGQ